MRVTLAGYTQLNPEEYPGNNSPEILPAAYARISRSEKSIDKLIREAQDDIPAARKSNERIVFGFGHSSIAEHAVFNLSIEGISRLCLEELERHRLVSYTEKSQRYTQAATDFMIPRGDPLLDTYHAEIAELIRGCRDFYQVYQDRGMPEEDARYFLPLCATGQVGVTINAREAEHVIRALLASSFDECVILGTLIRDALTPVVPSLIKYTTPSPSEAIRYAYSAQNITVDQRADWNVRHFPEIVHFPKREIRDILENEQYPYAMKI